MEQPESSSKGAHNFWKLSVQKLGLELKCWICLEMFNQPMLLPCDHIFCRTCIPNSVDSVSSCPICCCNYLEKDLRHAPHMEGILRIYKSMETALGFIPFPKAPEADTTNANVTGDQNKARSLNQVTQPSPCSPLFFVQTLDSDDNRSDHKAANCAKRLRTEGAVTRGTEPVEGVKICEQSNLNGEDLARETKRQRLEFGLHDMASDGGIRLQSDNMGAENSLRFESETRHKLAIPLSGAVELVEGVKICEQSDPNGEDLARETMGQRLEFGLHGMASDDGIHVQLNNMGAENSLRFESETQHKLGIPLSGAVDPTSYDLHANSAFVCVFCQSSEASEVYGPMLHYKDGKAVEVNESNQPGVQHVHARCIAWAPQVYYDGESVKNLESEIARAARLKCNKCGLKGAALGCVFGICRKSFHVPCAVSIDQCRWDMENFHMLCPTHSSKKFPSERLKSKKENHSSKFEIADPQPKKDVTASVGIAKKWTICGSDLSTSSEMLLLRFAKITGATVSKAWDPNVTHVIAATNERGAFCRTLKVLMGILNGRWILNIDWIKASVETLSPVNEEPYELNIDVHGCQDGPKRGRLRNIEKAPKLFSGMHFYFCGYFEPRNKHTLQELVEVAGGVILEAEDTTQVCDVEAECSTSLVVYSIDILPEKNSEDIALSRKQRIEEAEEIAFRTRSWVVHYIWILESIAASKLQPFSY